MTWVQTARIEGIARRRQIILGAAINILVVAFLVRSGAVDYSWR